MTRTHWVRGWKTAPREAAGLLRVLLVAVAVLGLLLPAVDHHLADRLPSHRHFALAGSDVHGPHRHVHEHEHHHVTSGPLVLVADAARPVAASATAVAPASVGETLSGPGRAPALAAFAPPLPLPAGRTHLLPAVADTLPSAQTVAPDPPPPVLPA